MLNVSRNNILSTSNWPTLCIHQKNSKFPEDGQKILPRIFPNECQLPNTSQLPHKIEGRIIYMTLYQ